MNEPVKETASNGKEEKTEEMKQRMSEIQDKIIEGINSAMSSTAEHLDKAADKIHETAGFFRNKNTDSLKDDVSNLTRKYPTYTLLGAAFLGFIFGRAISR